MEYKWLNKDSRTFLGRGYLKEGVTAEDRINKIAQTAESYLKIDGFAQKFKEYMSYGWYSLASPIWSNFGETTGLPISCVDEESWIITKYGGKQAKDICLQDELLTHKGRYRKVQNIIKTENRSDIYLLKIGSRMTPIKITGNHPVLTNLGWIPVSKLNPEIHLVAVNNIDGLIYSPIKLVEKTELVCNVYDFTVEEDHSFTVSGVVVHNCNGQYISDSMSDILTNAAETGMMSKYGAGTSAYFGDVRPRGSAISMGGQSFGAVHFMQIFDKITEVVSQSNVRRGNMAAYYPIEGGDVEEFLEIRSDGNSIQDLSIGITVTDAWLKEMVEGDSKKRKLWLKILKKRFETGYPYIFFTDTVNNAAPQVYKDKGMKIHASNLCVTGNQRVVSNLGLLTVRELYDFGQPLTLFDNDKSIQSSPMRLIEENVDVYKVTLENGMSHTITDYHKVVVSRYDIKTTTEKVECKDLKIGDKVAFQTNKGVFGTLDMKEEAYILGCTQERIPDWIWRANEETQLKYIKGLNETSSTVANKEFLEDLQILLANLGINTSLEGKTNHIGEYELKYVENTKKFSKIKSIEYVGKEDVYCCTVDSDEHLWICNGFITSNCTEIALSSDSSNSFVCDLSSMNLVHYHDWKETDAVETLTYFLDSVMSEYIDKTEHIPYMDKARNFAVTQRALGVGVLGWHSLLQSQMIPFESMQAKMLNVQIFKFIQERTIRASRAMAERYGEPELLKGYGMRNVTLQAVAPTTSSSFILGQVSPSIEPLKDNYFVKDLAKGKFTYKNPYLIPILENYGQNTKMVWDSILLHGGSVQHLSFLSDNEKMVFKTFGEISQKEIVIQAAARQKYIDQAQSINFTIHPDTPIKEVNELMLFAWEQGVKSLYYQRGTNSAIELARTKINECVSCEA